MSNHQRIPIIDPQLQSLFISILLHAGSSQTPTSEFYIPNAPVYEQIATSSKGEGLYTTTQVPRTSLIIEERPLVVWKRGIDPEDVWNMWQQMSQEAQEAFLQLSTNRPLSPEPLEQDSEKDKVLKRLMAIKATNGFNVELPLSSLEPSLHVSKSLLNSLTIRQTLDSSTLLSSAPTHASFLFPLVSRINHSCLPTADHCINWPTLQMQVYLVSTLPPSTEITIEYLPRLIQRTTEERKELLMDTFGFECACELCGANDDKKKRSDERRKEIDGLVKRVASREMGREDDLKAFNRIQELLEEDGYKAMPEFDEPSVSNAFVFWVEMMRQRQAQEEVISDESKEVP
ncbi:hypothetical protein BT69DRAFT_1341068 [Atractiella rhizophila]|nr:hypothetical protein BT69DRAFT_1341068 [Atractiella rhizophila]